MAAERPTLTEIKERMIADSEARVTGGVLLPLVSVIRILIIIFAGSIHLAYGFAEKIVKQAFVLTASGDWLTRLGRIFNIGRKAAEFASTTVTFTGVEDTVVPEGTQVQTATAVTYSTTEDVTITGGSANVTILADVAGESGNTDEVDLSLTNPISDIDTEVIADIAPNGGTEEEGDEALRSRILQRTKNSPSSGNVDDYERWAQEIAGVGRAWCLGAEDYLGAGTVGVIISDEDLAPVGSTILTNVSTYIETVRPQGVVVDVIDLTPFAVEYVLEITPDSTAIRTAIEDNLISLHRSEAAPGETLLLSHIRNAISLSSVNDYNITEMTINGVSGVARNVEPIGTQVATFSSATFSELT